MTCRKVRKLIPLAAGDDLRPRQEAALRAHLDACPDCRDELESFRAAMAGIKVAAKAESVADWSEGEWRVLMDRVTGGPKGTGEARGRSSWELRWAAASILGVVIGLIILSVLFRSPAPRLDTAVAEVREQDVLTMTLVSRETGLQVVWIMDKNFDWKGDRQ